MKTTVSECILIVPVVEHPGYVAKARCPKCRSTTFLHRRRKPFACKTCGHKMPRRLS